MDYRAVVTRIYDELNRGDVIAAYRDFAEDCVLTSKSGSIDGRDAMAESDRHILGQLSTHARRVERIIVDGDDAVTWVVWSGTVAATGKTFECPLCNVFHFDAGRVSRWESYGELAAAWAAFEW